MEKPSKGWRRAWVWALVASAVLHVALLLWLQRVAAPALPRRTHDSAVELTIEETVAPPATKAAQAPPAPQPARQGAKTLKVARLPALPRSEEAVSEPTAAGGSRAAAGALASDVPRKLDLSVRKSLPPRPPGGETIHNVPGEGDLDAHRPSLAQARINAWIEDDTARRRVEKGLVDDWFSRLGTSLDGALANNPPPPPAAGGIVSDLARGYLAAASSYGKTGTPGEPSGTDTSGAPPPVDMMGASAGIIPFSQPRLQLGKALESAPGLWAIIELDYGPGGKLSDSKVLSSSGDRHFDEHVITVVALGLPGLPGLPDAGLGIHADGTRSVWEVEGHLTFERDVKSLTLKDDAWYLPIAAATALAGAAAGSFDEVTGYVGYTDLRHPHLRCDVKLLKVY